ncbi:S1 RNA-binding domain-containing protein [Streptomyces sp. DSM 40750]|uniref:S1 RNA-binding domain-containing protein n=1 Tax=Streptomyces sp. DSM 40750 TaxID=2801030 RepID=UPI00214AABBC|nr:S1 RNA-binding domain-containing protein [Streptomyces sp. DSM 40750]UUU23212.1 S1 RNA-binding domain-containing protein [Streptomyces sp. DSM 40750]
MRAFLAAIRVGDVCGGVVAEVTRSHGAAVVLDGFPARPLGSIGSLDMPWGRRSATAVEAGRRITAEVTAVDLDEGRVHLSLAATEHPELWAFLKGLRLGTVLSGTVASIESFGVFVALDDGPEHPIHPGVGFITVPELSWRRIEAVSDVVRVGQRVSCEFLQFDTWNGEARLSLRAMRPDPFQEFADRVEAGRKLRGRVTKLVPFGVFVEVADGIEGLVPLSELTAEPVETPDGVVEAGDEITVVVTEVDRERRRLTLSRVRP